MTIIAYAVVGLLVGYFVIGEWFCGHILGLKARTK